MRVVVLAYGERQTPSYRFRFGQFEPWLRKEGVEVTCVLATDLIQEPDLLRRLEGIDLFVNQKWLGSPAWFPEFNRLGCPVLFDFDDALWTRPGRAYSWITRWKVRQRLHAWWRFADLVTCANDYLAARVQAQGLAATVVPMAIDTQVWVPRAQASSVGPRPLQVGWNGSPHNLRLLESLADPLRQLVQAGSIDLRVFCGQKPALDFPFHFTPFESGHEPAFVSGLDVSLLPLEGSDYDRGKSPIKALQSLAGGVPVVGQLLEGGRGFLGAESAVEVSKERGQSWETALLGLRENEARRVEMGQAGRRLVERDHSLEVIGRRLVDIWSQAIDFSH
ncbi:MAG: glycosyltransferase family 4 protein [Verrucomicrobiota bacterium]